MSIKIVGAGLTGMIAAHIFPQARVVEARTESKMQPHKALLRFRSSTVSDATGIPFRQVTVRKGIWDDDEGRFVQPSINASNSYSVKCTNKILPRSIWNVEPCERWIAPYDFIALLQDNLRGRIEYNKPFNFQGRAECMKHLGPTEETTSIISTVPMGIVTKQLGLQIVPEFHYNKIEVLRLDLGSDCDVHQTVYFPWNDTSVYRASITGSTLILESSSSVTHGDLKSVERAFGLSYLNIDDFEISEQKYGKIAPIDDGWRRNIIHRLSDELGVYSLGRFGTWRNIILDDVVHDCAVIKRLMFADSYTKATVRSQ